MIKAAKNVDDTLMTEESESQIVQSPFEILK